MLFDEPGSPRPHRVGAKAVELAENVKRRAGHLNRIVLRILAAAYAETDRFSEAIDPAQNVLQLADSQPTGHWVDDLQLNIANYEGNAPCGARPQEACLPLHDYQRGSRCSMFASA